MNLKTLNVIFIIIIIPIILLETVYIKTGTKTIQNQALYDEGLLSAVSDAIYSFEINTNNDNYSNNPEEKREILKASVKMFEKSLCNNCGISIYNTSEIDKYIPAIVYGLYDGFYMYAPTYTAETNTYEHALLNYVYYSEELDDNIVIRYSLDNYVTVYGDFGIKSGYLEYIKEKNGSYIWNEMEFEEKNYLKESYTFTNWFNEEIAKYNESLKISENNDPENSNSAFVQHKNQVIKNKMQGVLNSVITAYSEKTKDNYKMPKFTEEEWEKIYSNISVTAFFQGKRIGLTEYNGYCILNSTNHSEYPNPNLLYFIDNNGNYHDIRCSEISNIEKTIEGYLVGRFAIKKEETTNEDGTKSVEYKYVKLGQENVPLACYNCINGTIKTNNSIFEYVTNSETNSYIKTSYWNALIKERENKNHSVSSLSIGDYVNYDETKGGTITEIKTNSSNIKIFDGPINYNLTKKLVDTKWRYFGKDSDGNILLISDSTLNYVRFTAKENTDVNAEVNTWDDFYNNAVDRLNAICAEYGNGNYAQGARSINLDDISRMISKKIYGDTTTFTYKLLENGQIFRKDSTTGEETKANKSEEPYNHFYNPRVTSKVEMTVEDQFDVKYVYLENDKIRKNVEVNETIYDLLWQDSNYWLGNIATYAGKNNIMLGMQNIVCRKEEKDESGTVKEEERIELKMNAIFNSNKMAYSNIDKYIRAVVILKSDVKINTAIGNGTSDSPYELSY